MMSTMSPELDYKLTQITNRMSNKFAVSAYIIENFRHKVRLGLKCNYRINDPAVNNQNSFTVTFDGGSWGIFRVTDGVVKYTAGTLTENTEDA